MKFCVIGLGRFGDKLAQTLAEKGMEVLAIDRNESIIASIRDKVTQAICMNVENEESLKAVGIEDMDTVIVAMGEEFSQSILVTALLKKHLNVPKVIARAVTKVHENILMLVGADKVIFPERDTAIKLANTLSFALMEFVQVSEKFAIAEIKPPKNFIGKTISELQLRKTWQVTCIGIKKEEEITLINPDYVIIESDKLLLAGSNERLADIAEEVE
ncbi:TrkA family potassium uptake protein [Candidatus Babeliales bacterium]|nr:TrkA family potassium uptake protein [Candidatus Babeliales bacterium]